MEIDIVDFRPVKIRFHMSNVFQNVLYSKREGIATITLNRPKFLNAMNLDLLREMRKALDDARRDPAVKVVVITGVGERAFSAGADISMFQRWIEAAHPEFEERALLDFFHYELGEFIINLEKPVIAAVNGYALGGGWELLQFCDIIIASDDAKFGQPEINLGISPGVGTALLPRHIPLNKAKEICFTGDMIDAQEAARLGFVNKVVPKQRLMEETYLLAGRLKEKSALALQLCKAALNRSAADIDISSALSYTKESCCLSFTSDDAKEGIKAFMEKRKPTFKMTIASPV